MNFHDYITSVEKTPIRVLTSWQRNTDISKLKIEPDLKHFYAVCGEIPVAPVLLVHTKAEGLIAPDVKHREREIAQNINLSWIQIKQVNEDESLNCVTSNEKLFEIDDSFKEAFAEVFDFLSWEEFLDENGLLSDLAIKLIINRL
ncbi:hypothetical protein [uncultured Fibrobacter sp.]|uniref:hypothetical protein n=1 Tax=uncultured Fibrobacter sp. TaxID=261512 RepID=UPI002594FC33|nr:hypothetical protein [uncultured Fibrobacter sp.]